MMAQEGEGRIKADFHVSDSSNGFRELREETFYKG
jgi:hypothetical protein